MKKAQLIEFYKNDTVAVDIIKKSGKREKGLLFIAGGLSVLSVFLFILGDIANFSGSVLSNLFIIILLGIFFIILGLIAFTLIINYFTGKKRRLYNRLKTYFTNK